MKSDTPPFPPELDDALAALEPDEAARLREAWQALEPVSRPPPTAEQLDAVRQAIRAHRSTPAPVHRLRPRRLRWAVAATLLVGAIGLGLWLQPVSVTAPTGERVAVQLPDGSTATLNSRATLRYPRRFGDTRNVTLTGEAFFDVTASNQPFQVATFNTQVTVLGTRFNVRAWPQDPEPVTVVALESGRVSVTAHVSPADTVFLLPGQQSRVGAAANRPATPEAATHEWAWLDGSLIFRDQLLATALPDLQRRYGLILTLNHDTLATKRLSLVYRTPPEAEVVLADICRLHNLNYRPTAGGYELYARSAP